MTLSSMDLWRLSDELGIIDAVILITGNDPSEGWWSTEEVEAKWVQKRDYDGFEPVFKALRNAAFSNAIPVNLVARARDEHSIYTNYRFEGERRTHRSFLDSDENEVKVPYDIILKTDFGFPPKTTFTNREIRNIEEGTSFYFLKEPSWEETTVKVDVLKKWLSSKGIYPSFFFPDQPIEGFRNKEHSRYSPKLACAVAAWEAVEQPSKNKSVKATLDAWIQANAVKFDMVGEDGTPTDLAVKQVASVANWQTSGGAVKTSNPGPSQIQTELEQPIQNFEDVKGHEEPDPEIPF